MTDEHGEGKGELDSDVDSDLASSANIVKENVDRLREIFPDAFTDGVIDFETLRQLLGDDVSDTDEKYGLNWHGKRRARQLALTPSTGTLRPSPDDSVDWDTTQNMMIEGDNLEVLKLLQKPYAGKVKLIYIDPPYNTGKDFIYPDNYQDTIQNYMELTGQVDEEGKKLSTNAESSGRFHTDWLNMMYPRLKLARNLLREDGVIFISVGDQEVHNLRTICEEVFGASGFVETYVWTSTFRPDNSSPLHRKNAEFVLCFARDISQLVEFFGEEIKRTGLPSLTKSTMKPSVLQFPAGAVEFGLPDGTYEQGPRDSYALLDDVEVRDGRNTGPFRLEGRVIWGQENLIRELDDGTRILIKTEGFVPYVDKGEVGTLRPSKLIPRDTVADVLGANAELRTLFGGPVYSYPKPTDLIRHFIRFRGGNDLVLDFFAGSGTTGHAVMAQNAEDGGNRRYLLVQLPEPLDPENKDQKVGAEFCAELGKPLNIAELTKERLRRAAKKVKADNPDFDGDLGFRVFKLDSSNIRAWDPQPDDLEQSLEDSVEHLKAGRSEQDVLYELLLKLGLDLCVPIETETIGGCEVHSIGAGVLFACLGEEVDTDVAEELGTGIVEWRTKLDPAGDTTCVFRDSTFTDNVAKSNLSAILQQGGIETVRSV